MRGCERWSVQNATSMEQRKLTMSHQRESIQDPADRKCLGDQLWL